MVKKYSKKLVFDYIVGNELVDYDIDELENDYEFMIEVIKHTKDKNLYNLCSDEVKKNYNFVKFIVETFKNDFNFIVDVGNNYLKTVDEDDINAHELTILISKGITSDMALEDPKLCSFKLQASSFYEIELIKLAAALEQTKDESLKEEYGLGFLYILDTYEKSNTICNFFAKRLIDEIFYENEDYTLEQILHMNFKSFNKLKAYGINTFLTDYIKKYDKHLSSYALVHLDLLEPIKKSVRRIEKNWDNYVNRINSEKVNIYEKKVEEYVDKYGMTISTIGLINYVTKKLCLESVFYKYDTFLKEYDEMEDSDFLDGEEIPKIDVIDEKNMDFHDLSCVKYATKLAIEMFKNNDIDIIQNEYEEKTEDNKKTKSFKINFNNKKNRID